MYHPHISEYTHRVTIDKRLELDHHYDIHSWCRDQFGDDKHCVTWRHALSGTPHMSHEEFSTWLFTNETDATLFRMRWTHV